MWETHYILEASDYTGIQIGSDSITLELQEEIPENSGTNPIITPTDFNDLYGFVLIYITVIPTIVGGAIFFVILFLYRRQKIASIQQSE